MADFIPANYNDFRNRMAAMNLVTQGVQGGANVLAAAFRNRALSDVAKHKDELQAALAARKLDIMEKRDQTKKEKEPASTHGSIVYTKYDDVLKKYQQIGATQLKDANGLSMTPEQSARYEFATTSFPTLLSQMKSHLTEKNEKGGKVIKNFGGGIADASTALMKMTTLEKQNIGIKHPELVQQLDNDLPVVDPNYPDDLSQFREFHKQANIGNASSKVNKYTSDIYNIIQSNKNAAKNALKKVTQQEDLNKSINDYATSQGIDQKNPLFKQGYASAFKRDESTQK